jgi:hypothetical protein
MTKRLSRRTVLKGLGAAVALPFLDAMAPLKALAGPSAATPPRRLGFLYVPNGAHMQDWTPATIGPLGELPLILEPLKAVKSDVTVFSGLTLDKARANGDGPGDHARAMSTFLTGRQPRKTAGADIRVGKSADQIAADHLGRTTRFPSLELGIERGQQAGNCDSGYSCAYSSNLSWRGESTPNAKEVDPKAVFERLFGNAVKPEETAGRAKRERYNKSILDLVQEDATDLKKQLGAGDLRKMDEYTSAVRELELRIQKVHDNLTAPPPKPNVPAPAGVPKEYADHIRLMMDLMVLAWQTDQTRVVTFPLANDGSNRAYPMVGVSEGHHDLSHHGNDKAKQEKIRTINKFHVTQFAYLLEKLKGVKEGDKTLLDSCMIVYGSGISDGNAHNHDELPILLAGHGGGSVKPGRHVRVPKETPLMNLYLAMLERVGATTRSLGDSTGVLAKLDG